MDVANALARARPHLVDLLVDLLELVADLVEDREAVVVQVVEHLVEEPSRPAREEVVPELLVLGAALEEPRHRLQLDGGQRDDVVRADEDVELAGVQPSDVRVVDGEVEDGEEVAVRLSRSRGRPSGAGAARARPRCRAGASRSALRAAGPRRGSDLEVDPGESVAFELSEPGLTRGDLGAHGLPDAARTDAGQARHLYSEGLRSLAQSCSQSTPENLLANLVFRTSTAIA